MGCGCNKKKSDFKKKIVNTGTKESARQKRIRKREERIKKREERIRKREERIQQRKKRIARRNWLASLKNK